MISRWKIGPIGLDISERTVFAAQLAMRGSGERRLVAAACLPRATRSSPSSEKLGADEAMSMMATLQRQGFRGKRIVLGLPRPMLMSAVIDLPPRGSGAPLDMIARTELARAHRATPEEMESTWWELPTPARAGAGTCAMAVGCTHAAAELIVSPLDELIRTGSAELFALDARCVAMCRACEPIFDHESIGLSGVGGVLELGWSRGELTMLIGSTPIYERALDDAGLCHVHARLVKDLSIDAEVADYALKRVRLKAVAAETPADELNDVRTLRHARTLLLEHLAHIADEVRVAFAYAHGRYPSSVEPRLLLVGETARAEGIDAVLHERLGHDVMIARPGNAASIDARAFVGRESLIDDPALTTALGLASWSGGPLDAEQTQGVAA